MIISKNSDEIKNIFNCMNFDEIELKYCSKIDESNPLGKWRNHSHDFLELIYFLDGRAKIKIQDESLNLSLYDIIAYPPNVSHQEFLDIRCKNDIICIGVAFDNISSLKNPFKLSDSNGKMKWLFEQIYQENVKEKKFKNEIINTYLKLLFLNIKRCVNSDEANNKNDILSTTTQYIYDHYQEEISLQLLSELVYISPSYLDRLFKNKMGTSPIKYLNLVRIQIAKKLLSSSDLSISEISERVGIMGPKYFSRLFKKTVNESPSEFRRKCSQGSQNT